MDSINYYNKNAETFINGTIDADMTILRKKFLSYIPKDSRLLDVGCGSGRDSRAFQEMGYDVYAMDGSENMVSYCKKFLGDKVILASFQEYKTQMKFDGIWASASLLHVEENEIVAVISKFSSCLKVKGIFYMSFKYGQDNYTKDNRFFNCYTQEGLISMLNKIDNIEVIDKYITSDVREGRENQKWVNILVRRLDGSIQHTNSGVATTIMV